MLSTSTILKLSGYLNYLLYSIAIHDYDITINGQKSGNWQHFRTYGA